MAFAAIVMVALVAAPAAASRPWRDDPLFRRIAERLDRVRAIDNHTHLLDTGAFDPALGARRAIGNRSTNPAYAEAMRDRFGIAVEARNAAEGAPRAGGVLGGPPGLHAHGDRPS